MGQINPTRNPRQIASIIADINPSIALYFTLLRWYLADSPAIKIRQKIVATLHPISI